MIKFKIVTNILQKLIFKTKITIKKIYQHHHLHHHPQFRSHYHHTHHRPLNDSFDSLIVRVVVALFAPSQLSLLHFFHLGIYHRLTFCPSPQLVSIIALFSSFGVSIIMDVTIIPHPQLFQIMFYSLVCSSRPKI